LDEGGSTSFSAAQLINVVLVAECVLLRDNRIPGGQDFFNDISVGIVARFLVA
jgi:hypothetical protein